MNCISSKIQIKEVISILDKVENKLLVVLEGDNKVTGCITDGDIRRGILQGITLDSCASKVMNKNPILLHKDESKSAIIARMEHELIFYVPLVDDDNKFIDLVSLDNLKKNIYSDYGVFVLAGGLGSRLKELTKDTPKPMLPIDGKPMLERLILSFKEQGFNRFYISVNYLKDKVINYFGDGSGFGVSIKYIEEKKRLGTAGPLSLLQEQELIERSLIVINSDICIMTDYRSLIRYHKKSKNSITVCAKEQSYKIPYGVIRFVDDSLITIDEKPVASYFINAGIYIVNQELLSIIVRGEYLDMPDYINQIKKLGSRVGLYPLHEEWLDVGAIKDYESVNLTKDLA